MAAPHYRHLYDAAALIRDHPPRFRNANKAMLFQIAYPDATTRAGAVEVTRWPQRLPSSVVLPSTLASEVRPDFYDYRPAGDSAVEWHVNFADPDLFCAYGTGLFAQDEMQVAEHPLLACVREALRAGKLSGETSDHTGATPILVRNVERRVEVSTNPDAAAGRPGGLYGNRFAAAPADVVRRATRAIQPPTVTNLIAMAAPSGGSGDYSARDIEYVFATAHTAFAAAVVESAGAAAVVHSGFWGCGAFGGNRRLMIALQALAARSAGVARLVLHAGDVPGVDDAHRGLETADGLAAKCGSPCSVASLVERAEMLACRWGVSDGN